MLTRDRDFTDTDAFNSAYWPDSLSTPLLIPGQYFFVVEKRRPRQVFSVSAAVLLTQCEMSI